jgi:hypothetical protein
LADLACRYEVEAAMNERSTTNIYRFTLLKKGAGAEVMQALVLLAIKETELIFGRAKRKLETNCRLSRRKTACTIEGGTECGEHLAKLLSGLLIKQVGDEGFRVNRLTRNGK